jgi:hypothetical protein
VEKKLSGMKFSQAQLLLLLLLKHLCNFPTLLLPLSKEQRKESQDLQTLVFAPNPSVGAYFRSPRSLATLLPGTSFQRWSQPSLRCKFLHLHYQKRSALFFT